MSRTGKAMAGAIFGLLLVLILISAPAFAQTPINDKCEDKCVDSILYLKGIWDIKLMECVYAYEQPCKYGCEDIATISKTPSCKEFPDKPPTNSTDYDETLWNMLRTMYQKKEDSVTMQIHGTEYSPYERGKVFLQLLGDDSTPINDSYCYCSIYYPDGFVKWVAEKDTGLVIGFHGVGHNVSDILSEAVLAIEMGATLEDVALTIHPHPTLSESLMEAAEVALGKAIHIFSPSGSHL